MTEQGAYWLFFRASHVCEAAELDIHDIGLDVFLIEGAAVPFDQMIVFPSSCLCRFNSPGYANPLRGSISVS